MRYKNLFIDLDDTLWDTFHNNKECLKEIFTDYHFDNYYESFEAFFAIYMPHNNLLWEQYRSNIINKQTLILERFMYMMKPMGINDPEEVLKLNRDFLSRTTTKTKLIAGSIELLEYLAPCYKLYILSNGFREVQMLKLKNSGLAPYFNKVILSEDAGIQKPNKKIFDYALVNTNSRRHESLMIGDTWEADITGAYHAKIDQVWYNPGNIAAKGFEPTYTVSHLSEIKNIL